MPQRGKKNRKYKARKKLKKRDFIMNKLVEFSQENGFYESDPLILELQQKSMDKLDLEE